MIAAEFKKLVDDKIWCVKGAAGCVKGPKTDLHFPGLGDSAETPCHSKDLTISVYVETDTKK